MTPIPHPIDPRIGVLMRNGTHVFYAYTQGYSSPALEGTLNEVEAALGVPLSDMVPTAVVVPAPAPVKLKAPKARTKGQLRRYKVTVKPSVILYSGSHTIGESVEYVDASDRRDAIKQVRQQLSEVNGRFGPKYNVTARLSDED